MCSRNSQLFVLFLVVLATTSAVHHCRQGRNDRNDLPVQCPTDQCVIFKYSDVNYKERMCYEDFADKHPALYDVACPHSHERARCFNRFSTETVPDTLIGLNEETFGEVLAILEVDSFCCCRGENCNALNHQMQNYYETDRPYHPHHHYRHHQHTDGVVYPRKEYFPGGDDSGTGSSNTLSATLITVLVAALLRH